MKKILICLPAQYYQKYIQLNAFKDLKKKYDVSFLLNKNKWNVSTKNIENKYMYSLDEGERAYFMKVLQLFLVANRKLSKTFKYQFRRWYPNLQDFIKIEKVKKREYLNEFTNLFYFKTLFKYFYKPFFKRLTVLFFF